VDPASADVLAAQLLARGKDVVYDRVEGADHSFKRKGTPDVDGWQEELGRIVTWFLRDPDKEKSEGGRPPSNR
jgi:hypothetical protein